MQLPDEKYITSFVSLLVSFLFPVVFSLALLDEHLICPFMSWLRMKALLDRQLAKQGMVDGSASKPALRQDTGYMVEKPYLDIVPYLGAFGAYLMPQ